MKNPSKPADGERRAMIGYVPQYRVAAKLIYEALVEGTFQWARITDPEAGRVDDIQIAKPGQLDAFQVKWSETVQNISFSSFVPEEKSKKSKAKPGLVRQLAEGWQQLVPIYPDRQVYVHLITRQVPSSKAQLPLDNPPPKDAHFQAFLRDCWQNKSWTEQGLDAVPSGWQAAMAAMQETTGLSNEDFLCFVQACDLHFNYQLPSYESTQGREEVRRIKDTEQIFGLLFEIAGGEQRRIQLDRDELLQHLGWEDRFKLRFRHEFRVDEKLYQPIATTVAELNVSLKRYAQGYLALIGTPGSGKSTTLTQTLRYRKGFRVIRYYAFVQDDAGLGRGEAVNFLHDLTLALKQQGVFGQGTSYPKSREELLEQLSSQLLELHERWQKEGVRTLILVDGLDHIEREQSPARTLLKDLPLPEQVPDGVLFILGSQKLNLIGLSPRIQAHLEEEEGRTLTMRPLDRQGVFSVVESAPFKLPLSYEQKEKIRSLSDGHPLALSYLLQRLGGAAQAEQVDEILTATNPYQGHIEQDYEVYWKSLEEYRDIRNLLALLCRLRGAIDPNKIVKWVPDGVAEQFSKYTRHYFRVETDSRWHFFHNSFRQFLLTKTGRNPFGVEDRQRHQACHRQLAEYAAQAERGTVWSWEELYHRAGAGDSATVLRLASQKNFRNQFYALRSLEDIQEDIALSLKTAQDAQDGLTIIRCFLIEAELRERNDQLSEVNFPQLLLELHGTETALHYVVRGRELRIDGTAALKFCNQLIERGDSEAARMIFDAAEPLGLLSGTEGINTTQDDATDQIEAWADIAHHFRSLEQILSIIDKLRADDSRLLFDQSPEEATARIQQSARIALADGVFASGSAELLSMLRNLLEKQGDSAAIIHRLDFQTCFSRNNIEEALPALGRLLDWANRSTIDDEDKTFIAEFLFRLRDDKTAATAWLEQVPQPLPYDSDRFGYEWENLSPFSQRICLNRLRSALGTPTAPVNAVPDTGNERQRGRVLFERMIVLVANLWGRAWRGDKLTPSEILRELHPAIVLFNRRQQETKDWLPWYELRRAAPDYFAFMIHMVSAHGSEALAELSEEFDRQWKDEATRQYWQSAWKRRITLELYRAGDSAEVAKERLSIVENEIDISNEVEERVRDYVSQAFAWLEVGEKSRAHALLERLLETSFGIYHRKDDQFSLWMEWLVKINAKQKEGIEERIRRFAGALTVLEGAYRGENTQEAAQTLIETTSAWNPGQAFDLSIWLLEHHSIHYTRAIAGLLTAALKDSDPPIEIIFSVARHLLIPFQADDRESFAELIAVRCCQMQTDAQAKTLLNSLVRTIETKELPSERWTYYSGLVTGLKQVGFGATWIEEKLHATSKQTEDTPHSVVTLASGEKLTEEEVISRVNSYEDMLSLIDDINEVGYIHWENVLGRIIENVTSDQIQILQERLGRFESRPLEPAPLAKRLSTLGRINEARNLAEQALTQSTPHGWGPRFYDDSRLEAVESLISIDPSYDREKIYALLVNDYLSESRYPRQFIAHLDRIVPILFVRPQLPDIWSEIEQHIYQLSDFSESQDFPPLSVHPRDCQSHADILLDVLFTDIALPIFKIRNEAHQAVCELIHGKVADALISERVQKLLADCEETHICALALLEATVDTRPDFAAQFSTTIPSLCASPSMTVRQIALRLAGILKLEPARIATERQTLPLTYQLELSEIPLPDITIPLEVLPEGQPLPDSNDPLELIRPFQDRFEMLSELTDIPLQNLVARAVTLMDTLKPRDEWNKHAEEKFRGWMEAVHLEISFVRPRVAVALRAFGHVLTELVDAQILDEKQLSFLQNFTRLHDPTLSLLTPVPRPPEIVMPNGEEMGSYPRKDWVNSGAEAFPLVLDTLSDGRIVLGELSRFVNLDRERPQEDRWAMICHVDWPSSDTLDDALKFFPSSSEWFAWDYPYLEESQLWPSTIICGYRFQVELTVKDWLAIHPDIPLSLGWRLATDGLFRWVDAEGAIMVESIRWQDGSIHNHSLRLGEVSAEGWLVVASPQAVELIAQAVGPAVRLSVIFRQYRDRDEKGIVHDIATNRQPAWER